MSLTPQYLKTSDMAKLIGYSGDFLLKNRGILFFENIHFFAKETNKRIDWKVERMIEWVEGEKISDKAKSVLSMVS